MKVVTRFSRALFAVIAGLACLGAVACTPLSRGDAVPATLEAQTVMPGMPGVRFWGDEATPEMMQTGRQAYEWEKAYLASTGYTALTLPPANFLAISGGGENGAFGAGVLCGWTKTGTRPEFKIVTGVSTGALTAPFAFLGSAYDDKLREIYTTLSAKDVLTSNGMIASILFEDAFADNAPLRATVAKYFDQKMLEAVGAEYKKGRVLLVGTTDLDARRPVIWDIGRIAISGNPGALTLVQRILVASAAIPGAFPPTMIDVEANGKKYQEMHVDGGATSQVFVYPPSLNVSTSGIVRERHLYVIRNARLDPNWAQVSRSTFSIAGKAIDSLIQTQGVGDLFRIYATSQRDHVDFNLAYIPKTFTRELKEPFETAYMNELFQVGYDLGVKGYPWEKAPPGLEALSPP